ncbi:hypothetical protein ACO0QE_003476 [Hanseniaspora vineae]
MGLLTTADKEKIKIALPKAFNKIIDITIARLYIAYPDPNEWQYTGLWGAVALVDDLVGNTMFLKLVDIQGFRGVLWDQELWVNFEYNQDRTFFHSFEMEECYAGLLFEDLSESAHFYKRVAKRQKYASKKTLNNKNAMALKKKVDEENQLNVVHGPRGETLISDQRKRYNYDLPQESHRDNHETTYNENNDEYDFAPPAESFSSKKAPPPPPPPLTMAASGTESNTLQQESNRVASPQRVESYASMDTYESTPQSESSTPAPSTNSVVHNVPPPPTQYMHSPPPVRPEMAQAGAKSEAAQNGGFAFPIPQQTGFGQTGLPPPPPPHPPAASGYGQPPVPPSMAYGQPPPAPSLPSRSNMPLHHQQAPQPNNFASFSGPAPGLPSRGSVPPPPPARRGAAPPPPPRRHGTAGATAALQPSRTGRAGPPPPPARRGAAPPPPPRAGVRPAMASPQPPLQVASQSYQQTQQYQSSQVPPPPPLPNMQGQSQSIVPPAPPAPPMQQQQQQQLSSIPIPPPLLPHMQQQSSIPAPPAPPPMQQQSNIPAPPPPPPMLQQSNIPAPPPPPAMGMPSVTSAPSSGLSEATGDAGRDALLASIRSAGIGSLKKTDKSQLEKPSVLLQESGSSGAGPSAPSGGSGGGPPSMADALAAALQSRKSKVAYNDDDDEGDW